MRSKRRFWKYSAMSLYNWNALVPVLSQDRTQRDSIASAGTAAPISMIPGEAYWNRRMNGLPTSGMAK